MKIESKKKMMTPLCIPPKMMMVPMPALYLFFAWYEDGQLKLLIRKKVMQLQRPEERIERKRLKELIMLS